MSQLNSHGSESSSTIKDRIVVLKKKFENKAQWSKEIQAAMGARDIDFMTIPGWNKVLSIAEAIHRDAEDQVKTKIQQLNVLAGIKSGVSIDFPDRVRDVMARRTPTKRRGEDDAALTKRELEESTQIAYAHALESLDPEQRERFTKVALFLDPVTRKIESKAIRQKRLDAWSRFVCPSTRDHHSEMMETVMEGDFGGLFGKVLRDKSEALIHTKESLLNDLNAIDGTGLTVQQVMDKFDGVRATHRRVIGVDIDPDLVKPKIFRVIESLGEEFAKYGFGKRIKGKTLKWSYEEITKRFQVVEDELEKMAQETGSTAKGPASQRAARATKDGKRDRNRPRVPMEEQDCYAGRKCNRPDCKRKHPKGDGKRSTKCF